MAKTVLSESQAQADRTDLILWKTGQTDTSPIEWPLGELYRLPPTPAEACQELDKFLADTRAQYVLFWDSRSGQPDTRLIQALQQEPIDIWHAGLASGTGGQPDDIDYISPVWMLNRDPDPQRRAISWRLSLNACLVRVEVLKVLGQIDPAFETLTAAGLEMGYRFVWRGAVLVNEPKLVAGCTPVQLPTISLYDRYVFLARHFSLMRSKYVLVRRALARGNVYGETKAYRSAQRTVRSLPPAFQRNASLNRPQLEMPGNIEQPTISVLIPTLCRYPCLKDTLGMLKEQTIKPLEVICVDQTPLSERQPGLYEMFGDLNLKVIWRDTPGQCSARNAGLAEIRGDYILFLDDDVRIRPDYIESLKKALELYRSDIAVGIWSQDQDQAIAAADRIYRVSDRLASGNSLARREVIRQSGGFDLHYDRNYRADADLGMRLYLSGANSIITPHAKEHSLSSSTGGLKFFKTFDGVRKIGLLRPWPAVTQTYYWLRYHSKRQIREAFFLSFIGSAIPREERYSASQVQKLLFIMKQLWVFPFRAWGAWQSLRIAKQMMSVGPRIPSPGGDL